MSGLWVIANPNAGGGRAQRVVPRVEAALREKGVPHTLQRTEAPGHARELAQAARRGGAERILIVGGDGTIHETVSGLLDGTGRHEGSSRAPALAVLPVGTGNDFYRMVRAGSGVSEAVQAVTEGTPRAFEVGEVRWDRGTAHFVNLVGVGIDVEVLRRRPGYHRLPGLLQYLAALASALRRFEPVPVKVSVRNPSGDPIRIETPVLLAAVTVGPSVGGGFLLSPNAVPDDGLLDLFLAGQLGLFQVARYLPGILRGSRAKRPGVWQLQGIHVEIEAISGGLAFELDGELVEASTPFLDIRVRPGGIQVLEPPVAP